MSREAHIGVLDLGKGKVTAHLPVGAYDTALVGTIVGALAVHLLAMIVHINEEEGASEFVCLEELHGGGDGLAAILAVGVDGLAQVIVQLDIHL